jgi:hypothetical protein
MLANETAKRKKEIWDIITQEVNSQFTKNNNQVILENQAICVIAS